MTTVSIQVTGGVAYLLGSTEPIRLKLNDTDNGEVGYYVCDGAEVYETEEEDVVAEIENALDFLED